MHHKLDNGGRQFDIVLHASNLESDMKGAYEDVEDLLLQWGMLQIKGKSKGARGIKIFHAQFLIGFFWTKDDAWSRIRLL